MALTGPEEALLGDALTPADVFDATDRCLNDQLVSSQPGVQQAPGSSVCPVPTTFSARSGPAPFSPPGKCCRGLNLWTATPLLQPTGATKSCTFSCRTDSATDKKLRVPSYPATRSGSYEPGRAVRAGAGATERSPASGGRAAPFRGFTAASITSSSWV